MKLLKIASSPLRLQKLLKLVSHPKKFAIIMHLTQGEECVCEIGEKLGFEQSLVSYHINSLRKVNIVKTRKVGTWVHCSLNKDTFEQLQNLFTNTLGPGQISDKMCSQHEACQC